MQPISEFIIFSEGKIEVNLPSLTGYSGVYVYGILYRSNIDQYKFGLLDANYYGKIYICSCEIYTFREPTNTSLTISVLANTGPVNS